MSNNHRVICILVVTFCLLCDLHASEPAIKLSQIIKETPEFGRAEERIIRNHCIIQRSLFGYILSIRCPAEQFDLLMIRERFVVVKDRFFIVSTSESAGKFYKTIDYFVYIPNE